jgi:hypothetical protein
MDVSICDLVKEPDDYNGKLVRVRAILFTWFPDGISLYDPHCEYDVSPIFDCRSHNRDAECKRTKDALKKRTDVSTELSSRVEATFTGMFSTSTNPASRDLRIRRAEKVKRVPPKVLWPDKGVTLPKKPHQVKNSRSGN